MKFFSPLGWATIVLLILWIGLSVLAQHRLLMCCSPRGLQSVSDAQTAKPAR
jgi:hypothetical protein